MGNSPIKSKDGCPVCNPSPATINYVEKNRDISEKEIINHVTKECKKCKEENDDLKKRIRVLNINNVNLNRENGAIIIEKKVISDDLKKIKNNYDLSNKQNSSKISLLENENITNDSNITVLNNQLNEKDKIIKSLNEKLLKNNCQRNYTLAESVKQLNTNLVKCNKTKEDLDKKTSNSTRSSQNCTAVQLSLQNELKYMRNKLQDTENTGKYKDSVIYNSDRYISMWRTTGLVFFIFFLIFLFLYIFKRGDCGDFEEKLDNLKILSKKK